MSAQWQRFLADRNVRPGAGLVAPSAADEPAPGIALYDLSHLGLIAARGEEAASFLQGQLTNDIHSLSPTGTQLASHCSPKGRMLAIFRILRLGETILLQLPLERLPDALKRLRMYVLRAKVRLDDASEDWVRMGVAGDAAPDALGALGVARPERDGGLARSEAGTVLRLPGPLPRFEILGSVDRLAAVWDALAPDSTVGNADAWALLDIRAGIPTIYAETLDAFVPQMCNMQLIDGVSFAKGCYTGQEVVARMQYLGRLKRRMYLGEVQTESAPRPGDALHSPASASEQGAGTVVDARRAGAGRYALLAVAEIAAAEGGEIRLGEGGPRLELGPPPYGFPPNDTSGG